MVGGATRFGAVEEVVVWAAGAAERVVAELLGGFTGVAPKVVGVGRIAAVGVMVDAAKAPGEEVSVVGVEVKKMGIEARVAGAASGVVGAAAPGVAAWAASVGGR